LDVDEKGNLFRNFRNLGGTDTYKASLSSTVAHLNRRFDDKSRTTFNFINALLGIDIKNEIECGPGFIVKTTIQMSHGRAK